LRNFIASVTSTIYDTTPRIWPGDVHPFFRQNLPEGYLLSVIREEFGPYLDGTDFSLLAIIGGMSIGRVTETPEGKSPGTGLVAVDIADLLHGDNSTEHFAALVRTHARTGSHFRGSAKVYSA
jgi:serine/threonine-protein kinase HipA